MKYNFLALLIAISFCSKGQTADNKNYISAGFGSQSYNGVLANTWFDFKYEWYGVAAINYSRYICSSVDVNVSTTAGNFGHCRDGYSAFWPDGETQLNMLGQLITVNAAVKYKFANGYILNENARIAPYVFAGIGVDPLINEWNRIVPGTYCSVMAGAGIKYNITDKLSFTYSITFGCFNNDKMDYGNLYAPAPANPLYMQNVYSLGYTF